MAFDKIHEVSKMQLNVILMAWFIMILICSQYIFAPCKQLIKKRFKKPEPTQGSSLSNKKSNQNN